MHNQCMYCHVYAEGVCLLPWDCYKTVELDNAFIDVLHCSCIPAYVHFVLKARKAVSKLYILLQFLTKLQPAATQHLGMV